MAIPARLRPLGARLRPAIERLAGVLVIVALAAVVACAADKKRPPATDDPNSPNYVGGGSSARRHNVNSAKRDELIKSIEQRLEQLEPTPPAKKPAQTDYFVIGTAEMGDGLTLVNFVNFLTIQGQHEAAAKIADFLLEASGRAKRHWQPMGRVKSEAAAKKLLAGAQAIEKKVEAFSPRRGKRAPDDAFAVGTAELNLTTQHADVRFQVICGTKAVANFLIAYVLAAPQNTLRQWHVFSRAHSAAEAEQFVADLREEYDQVQAKRQAIAAIYQARTTRRC